MLNRHLISFFEDEITESPAYSYIRSFAESRNIDLEDCISAICDEFEGNVNSFGVYCFIDAIENFIFRELPISDTKFETMYDVLDAMWECDYFEQY